jgi:ankyrin repeat protein
VTKGKNSARKQSRGLTPWHDAVRSGDASRVQALLDERSDIDALDEHGQTALMNAVYWGNFEVAKLLVDRGAALNHTGKLHLTALYLAVIGDRIDMVELLIQAGADTNIKGSSGEFNCTPREYAQQKGKTDVVRLFEQAI